MAVKLWKHLVLVVVVAETEHHEFGLADHINVFIMLSACLSASPLDPVRQGSQLQLYMSIRVVSAKKISGALSTSPRKIQRIFPGKLKSFTLIPENMSFKKSIKNIRLYVSIRNIIFPWYYNVYNKNTTILVDKACFINIFHILY